MLPTSARAFLSYCVAGSLAVPREQIQSVTVPLLIVHGSNDAITPLEFSQDVAANAVVAPSVELVKLQDRVKRDAKAGHNSVGLEAETTAAVAAWLANQFPAW
jgi:pimeloyl-ACP methyl ester carboxylesterase